MTEIYLDLLRRITAGGVDRGGRTGTGTRNVFGRQMRFDLTEGFPLLTTRRVHTRSIFGKLLQFLRDDASIAWLHRNRIIIWNEWTDRSGDFGPIYGYQWRSQPTPDGRHVSRLAGVIESLHSNPESRRHIVPAWSVADADTMALSPYHTLLRFYVTNGGLNCQLYQRSADVFLGVPFNITSYTLLAHFVAQVAGLDVGGFIHTLGDAHVCHNHFDQVAEQLIRQSRALPRLILDPGI